MVSGENHEPPAKRGNMLKIIRNGKPYFYNQSEIKRVKKHITNGGQFGWWGGIFDHIDNLEMLEIAENLNTYDKEWILSEYISNLTYREFKKIFKYIIL